MSRPSPSGPKTPSFSSSDVSLDATLRPSIWEEYIGQHQIKENLRILLAAAKERGQSPEHVLLYGPAGLGKTTLAHLIATELGGTMKVTSGPAIEKIGDLAALLTNLSPGDILFIDEIHRLNRSIEEVLYPAMESGRLDIIIGKGPSARTVQLELPPFTLVAATTRMAMLSAPLRSRFSGGTFRLAFYTEEEILDIVRRSAKILGIEASEDALKEIAQRSRFTPRTANHLLKRARDFAQVIKEPLSLGNALKAFDLLGVDHVGLMPADRKLLSILIENFGGGPAGLSTLSASLSEDIATIEEVLEPYLMQLGFVERTPRGRTITEKGRAHVGKTAPQEKLL